MAYKSFAPFRNDWGFFMLDRKTISWDNDNTLKWGLIYDDY